MPLDPKLDAVAKWAVEEFAGGFASAVEGMAGVQPGVATDSVAAPPEPGAPAFRWQQPISGLVGEAFAAASEADVLLIGRYVLVAAGIEDASPAELQSAFRESLGQAFSVLARAMTTRLRTEITPSGGADGATTPADLAWGAARLTLAGETVTVFLGLPATMLEPFAAEPKAVAQAATASAGGGPSTPQTAPAVRDESKTFDLLLDVELPVSVSFGHAHIPLKDVLKLTTGSIVELSRAVIEPVDIVVNNCVIAKGEVVVIEGNFGVRIQQVISRSERLRSLQ